jgi:transcriptional regulator with XRE-family HTH domain
MSLHQYLKTRQRDLAEVVRLLRRRRGLTQVELAHLLGSSRSRIARIEAGSGGYRLEELEVLLLHFGVPFEQLLSGESRQFLETAYTHNRTGTALGQTVELPVAETISLGGIKFAPNGVHLAAFGEPEDGFGSEVYVWNSTTGTLLATLAVDYHAGVCAFSPDGSWLAVSDGPDSILLWHWQTGECRMLTPPRETTEDYPPDFEPYEEIQTIAFTPNGQYVGYLQADLGVVRLFEVATGRYRSTQYLFERLAAHTFQRQGLDPTTSQIPRYGQVLAGTLFLADPTKAMIALDNQILEFPFVFAINYPHKIRSVAYRPFGVAGSLYATGGEGFVDICYTDAFAGEQFYQAQVPGTVDLLTIVNDRCVLGALRPKNSSQPVTLYNFVANQPLVLPAQTAEWWLAALAPDGSRVCFMTDEGLVVQMLNCTQLTYPELALPLTDHSQQAQILAYQAATYPVHKATGSFPAEEESTLDLQGALKYRAREGAYALAYLPTSDRETLMHLNAQLRQMACTKLVELPERGPHISVRTLLGYLDDHLNPETRLDADEVITTLTPYDIIIIDRAERLPAETLAWFVSRNDTLKAAILLVARQQGTFEQVASDANILLKAMPIDLGEFLVTN